MSNTNNDKEKGTLVNPPPCGAGIVQNLSSDELKKIMADVVNGANRGARK